MSRRFTISYGDKHDIEGVLYSDGSVHINDTWMPSEFDSMEQLVETVGGQGRHYVEVTWIDEEVTGNK